MTLAFVLFLLLPSLEMSDLTGSRARELRQRNGWSLQMLANQSGINKAYLSEFENGLRQLAEEQAAVLQQMLEAGQPAGSAIPEFVRDSDGHLRLQLRNDKNPDGYQPRRAFLEWAEEDGTVHKMFVGEREPK